MANGIENIEFNDRAFQAVLQSPEVQADILRRGQAIAAAAGQGGGAYDVEAEIGAIRARVLVTTADHAARKAEATNRTLTASLDAGRA